MVTMVHQKGYVKGRETAGGEETKVVKHGGFICTPKNLLDLSLPWARMVELECDKSAGARLGSEWLWVGCSAESMSTESAFVPWPKLSPPPRSFSAIFSGRLVVLGLLISHNCFVFLPSALLPIYVFIAMNLNHIPRLNAERAAEMPSGGAPPSPLETQQETQQKSSFDPRYKRDFSFALLEHENTQTLLYHYQTSSIYWQQAYMKAYSSMSAFTDGIQNLSKRIENIERLLARLKEVPTENTVPPTALSGNFSPSTPQAMTAELLTPMEPAWLK
ncbi:hypothetical protein F4824DRAFT_269676 [Ustulina deusta]|nr:hypothetical protein F4824DRAFT_269676 [Ustulina deusta]